MTANIFLFFLDQAIGKRTAEGPIRRKLYPDPAWRAGLRLRSKYAHLFDIIEKGGVDANEKKHMLINGDERSK